MMVRFNLYIMRSSKFKNFNTKQMSIIRITMRDYFIHYIHTCTYKLQFSCCKIMMTVICKLSAHYVYVINVYFSNCVIKIGFRYLPSNGWHQNHYTSFNDYGNNRYSWRRHQMETTSASLAFVWGLHRVRTNREARDLRRHLAHYDVIVMIVVSYGQSQGRVITSTSPFACCYLSPG